MVNFYEILSVSYLVLATIGYGPSYGLDYGYHDYEELNKYLNNISLTYPANTYLYSIGKSVRGKDLWVIAISAKNPLKQTGSGQRHLKFIANIHGNEAVGRELMIHLIEYLLPNGGMGTMNNTFDDLVLHILPSMNPDGFEATVGNDPFNKIYLRENANGFDLNRNFPDFFQTNIAPKQPETLAVMDWIEKWPFIFSLSFHGGTLVVNYPYDNANPAKAFTYFGSPDDDIFRNISKVYSFTHPYMYKRGCQGENFVDGITNGVQWYPVLGGMQDYNYIFKGIFELTVEVACPFVPQPSSLKTYWVENRDAIKAVLLSSLRGVSGFVKDERGGGIGSAKVFVDDRKHPVYTTQFGEFWRILLPGSYKIKVEATNYTSTIINISIPDSGNLIVNVTLKQA